jgi:hypothetical protein
MLKSFSFGIGALSMVMACTKPCLPKNEEKKDLMIVGVTTPATVEKGNQIVSQVRCEGQDLCYSFSNFEIKESGVRQFEIRAKANYPAHKNVVCGMAIYVADTVVKIDADGKGQYILQFYNANQLFKSDTVVVN